MRRRSIARCCCCSATWTRVRTPARRWPFTALPAILRWCCYAARLTCITTHRPDAMAGSGWPDGSPPLERAVRFERSVRLAFGERRLHAERRHELCEIGSDFRERLAQKAREKTHDRRVFSGRRVRRNTAALDLPIRRAHPDYRHAECREHV